MSTTTHEGLEFEDPIIEPTEQTQDTTETENKETPEAPKEDKVARQPTRYEGESDTQYSLRVQLFNAGLAKSQAETDEEKSLINERIKEIRSQMYPKNNPTETTKQEVTDTELFQTEEEKKAAIENLRKLGFVSQEEVQKQIQEVVESVRKEQMLSKHEANVRSQQEGIKEFYSNRPDIASNPEAKQIVEKTVLRLFNITPDTSKEEIMQALEMSASYLFPNNRSQVAQKAQEKIALMNISGSNKSQPSTVSDDLTSTLKASGWSDEDIKNFS